jgi:DNA-binding FadR family transcriptional regulator
MRVSDARLARRVQSAPQQIAAAIRESIMDGTLLPGSRLPTEKDMAESFGVSRPTIREALRGLKHNRVITAVRGRNGGHSVAAVSPRDLASGPGAHFNFCLGPQQVTYGHFFEVRYELELLAARAAAVRRDDEDLARLDELSVLLDPLGDPGLSAHARALHYDLAFHRRLADCAHNPLLSAFESATVIAFQNSDVNLDDLSADELTVHLDDVLEAVRRRSPEDAVAAMRRHLARSNLLCGPSERP